MDSAVVTLSDAIRMVDLAGVLANAILGGIAARTARFDLVGFVILAILSGLGGGMIRDTLLQQGSPSSAPSSRSSSRSRGRHPAASCF